MLKKIVVGFLSLSVLGAGGAALAYQASQEPDEAMSVKAPLAEDAASLDQGVVASENLGDPWDRDGIVASIDEFGFTLREQNGEEHYVELGPPDFWQVQDAQIQIGQEVNVQGSINEGMIHAYQVQIQDGETLTVRTQDGQPFWSGGVDTSRGGGNGAADGSHTPDPQAQVDEWITVQGELIALQNGNMTISTLEGDLLSFQTGQPRFLAGQGITFQVGDEVSVVGFYADSGEFTAGEVTQIKTGARVMLRDPNGRPLWAGPGNGRGNSNSAAQ
ncbi:MAG: hypothetical protein PVI04_10460 [Anaerolineales bacterium]